jgi:hypothetical protein
MILRIFGIKKFMFRNIFRRYRILTAVLDELSLPYSVAREEKYQRT